MIPCVSVENMRLSDAYTIANFVPSLELMYRAAMSVFMAHHWQGSTAIVVGSGNNGGDGFALAWILKKKGFDCTVFTVSQHLSDDSAYYATKANEAKVSVILFEKNCLQGFDTVVDCLLGTGFSGTVRSNYRDAIEAINKSGAYVISVDINSGMNGDTGEAEIAVQSDLTVTIGFVKTGLVTENAGKCMKKLICADIGIKLVRKEGTITKENCPPWLDMEIIRLI
ncbi:MAG: NAD(P)H-hydrate epimerase [Oscillospiraceae bacterium]|nr:NAD(P)H-hydrate epimerase [Oscillospiraceae bacterium]